MLKNYSLELQGIFKTFNQTKQTFVKLRMNEYLYIQRFGEFIKEKFVLEGNVLDSEIYESNKYTEKEVLGFNRCNEILFCDVLIKGKRYWIKK